MRRFSSWLVPSFVFSNVIVFLFSDKLLVPEGEEVEWDKLFPKGFRPLPRRWVVENTQSQDP
jgi:hypothetical protein